MKYRFLVIVFMVVTSHVSACMWDKDTLEMERQRFPATLELITGKFLRHSQEFYQWRIIDCKVKLKTDTRNLDLYDDLAVAYDKVGEHEKAIDIMLKKDILKPGEYKTEANLGTFYIHNGQLKKGLEHITKAIKINPKAHFGREIYQKYLVQYVLSKKVDGKLSLPMNTSDQYYRTAGFALFVLQQENAEVSRSHRAVTLKKALKGVLGMMKFGNYDSPVLLEVLADILLAQGYPNDGKLLAVRAYLKASYGVKEQSTIDAYRARAKGVLRSQVVDGKYGDKGDILKLVEKSFQEELDKANALVAKVHGNEALWIQEGLDVVAEFAKKYYKKRKK